MGHIPHDTEWFTADLIMEIIVHGSEKNVVHRNLRLIRAKLPEEAYEKATKVGRASETSYQNPMGQRVEIHFRGIAKLDAIYEPLEDGAEIAFEELTGISEEEILSMIPPKNRLDAFIPPTPGMKRDPNYSSQAVVEQALKICAEKNSQNK